jgi:hypothetical protein
MRTEENSYLQEEVDNIIKFIDQKNGPCFNRQKMLEFVDFHNSLNIGPKRTFFGIKTKIANLEKQRIIDQGDFGNRRSWFYSEKEINYIKQFIERMGVCGPSPRQVTAFVREYNRQNFGITRSRAALDLKVRSIISGKIKNKRQQKLQHNLTIKESPQNDLPRSLQELMEQVRTIKTACSVLTLKAENVVKEFQNDRILLKKLKGIREAVESFQKTF